MSIDQLEDLLVGFNTFLSSSDGLIPITSQEDSAGEWSTHSASLEHRAHHLNVLQTPSVIEECCNFIEQILSTNPPDAVSILFITPSWLGEDSCDTISDGIRGRMNLPSSQIELFDFSVLETVSQTTIQSIDLSGRSAADFQLLIPSLNFGSGSLRDALAQQVKKVVDFIIQQKGGKVFIIGHSVGGLAMRYYTEGWATRSEVQDESGIYTPEPPTSSVLGAISLATPHAQRPIRLETDGGQIQIFLHLLKLLSVLEQQTFDTLSPSLKSPLPEVVSGELQNATLPLVEAISALYDSNFIPKRNPEVN